MASLGREETGEQSLEARRLRGLVDQRDINFGWRVAASGGGWREKQAAKGKPETG